MVRRLRIYLLLSPWIDVSTGSTAASTVFILHTPMPSAKAGTNDVDPSPISIAEMRVTIEIRDPLYSTNAKGEFNWGNPTRETLNIGYSDYVCHGDDPVLVSTVDRSDVPPITQKNYNRMLMSLKGKDCYENAKKAGKYKEYPRTTGISTTSLIDRILLPETRLLAPEEALWKLIDDFATSCPEPPPIIDLSDPNNRHDTLPRDNPRDVSTLATWDECGERPLLDTLERVLAVLQCRYTSAVIIDAPVEPTAAFLSEVTAKFVVNPGHNFSITNDIQVLPVSVPKLQTINELRERLKDRKDLYSARQKKKRT
ncbi:Cytidylyltransferase-like [Rhizoctonia solani]|uniref:Cytidylyltransferase-like n=1 Tax=Rhizoctonia solani TaxID=456999 RepID=A0A8H7M405_9AGAM|nr:Cytidylyltransferase-like [Rhizoctonia solani]